MNVTKKSMITGCINTLDVDVDPDTYVKWMEGKAGLIQNVFPNLSVDSREFLMTGITPDEWDKHMS
tara:strand:- start:277 stop:474 length:198 start_codon:yes stop_codon:yes gene_type:complete